jgi:hypothetical protein
VGVTVKAKSLDPANQTGTIMVRVNLEDGSSKEYSVKNNIETLLPDSFKAIQNVNISNY